MKVKDLDGRIHTWNLKGHIPKNNSTRERSAPHLATRELLKEEFPTEVILEEVFLPGIGLYADFYIPSRRLMVEIHGRQHDQFVPHFHGTLFNFVKAQKRDRDKAEWCSINNIRLVVLRDTEDVNEWRNRIRET